MYAEKPKLHARQKEYKPGQLRTIAFEVTLTCNMNCPHCYAAPFFDSRLVDLDAFGRAAEELYGMGVHHYILQGGEAIMDRERLAKTISLIHPEETYINVISNGWAMDRDTIRWLKDLGVDKIAFSFDSGIDEEHNANRMPGSLPKTKEAINNVIEEGLLTSISTVVTHQSLNSEGFQKAIDFALEKQIRIDTQIAMPVGRWAAEHEKLITDEDAAAIRELRDKCGKLKNGQYVINRDVFNFSGCEHCPAGTEFMAITGTGEFIPCNFIQFTLGNIAERSVCDMRKELISCSWFDGKHSRCLCGHDREFIEKYIEPSNKMETLPVSAHEHLGIERIS